MGGELSSYILSEKGKRVMNMKWMSLVAVMVVFSVGCSETDQSDVTKKTTDEVISTVPEVSKASEVVETTNTIPEDFVEDVEKANDVKSDVVHAGEGIPLEKMDAEVKGLVEKLTADSDVSEEDAAKLEKDLKGVFQQIEAERQK